MNCTTNALTISHLTVIYGAKVVLDDISVVIPRGVICAVIGPNGAGKSTLLQAIIGLVRPLAGIITINGMKGTAGRASIAYVPQRSSVDWHFPISVFDVVMMGRTLHSFFWRPTLQDHAIVAEALRTVGMEAYAQHLIGELSGGQQQRVFLARALAQQRSIVILDEPFTGIDAVTEAVYIEVLKALRSQGITILLVHHDIAAVTAYADWALLLQTKIIKAGPLDMVATPQHLTSAYGRAVQNGKRDHHV